jgi:branched-chain amino acid transport system permease protein
MISASLSMLPAAIINGFMYGAIYALVALGLTLIYGVLHIINFAHGAMLMLALYAAFFLFDLFNIDPYFSILIVTPCAFVFGYLIYRYGIGSLAKGKDQNILLITLGLSIIIENGALFFFSGDQKTVNLTYGFEAFDLGFMYLSYPKAISFVAALVMCAILWAAMSLTDLGRAIRAVAKERQGARLVGINVEHIFAVTFGIGIACLGAAGCMMLPIFYVDPYTGNIFVLVAFTIVVLGGMGSVVGSLVGGFIIGITESVGGLLLGESLGQIGISLIFILILIFRPTGLFGSKV